MTAEQETKKRPIGLIIAGIVTALALLVGIGFALGGDDSTNADPGNGQTLDTEQLAELLTVRTVADQARCVPLVQSTGRETVPVQGGNAYAWEIDALLPVGQGGRLWSDAVSKPFVSEDPAVNLSEVMLSNCIDSLFGSMVANYFANLTVEGIKVVDLNPWLAPWVGDPATVVNTKAAEFAPLIDVVNPTQEQLSTATAKQLEWQGVAEKLNTLLLRFELGGREALPSVKNYHLLAGGLVVGNIPAIGFNTEQEDLPALVLRLTKKDACPPLVIGFNTGDKRLEEFAPPVCEEIPPTESTTPGTTVPGESTTTTTTPGTTPPGESTTTTTTPGTTPPGESTTTTAPPEESTTTTPTDSSTSTTVPRSCGDKVWYDDNGNGVIDEGECRVPPTTIAPPPVVVTTATTVQPAPAAPSTAAPDTVAPGTSIVVVDTTPPPNTYTPPGAVVGTTQPPTTPAPPATPAVTAPPGGGSTPTR